MKKILQMADVFNVSTDYLLRDEIEEPLPPEVMPVDNGLEEETVRRVSMEEAGEFLIHNEESAVRISTGVMLCILSPVILLMLGGMAEAGIIPFSEQTATMIGTIILLLMIAAAVAMFIMTGMKGKRFEYLENLNIDTEYGVSGMARERRSNYADTHSRLIVIGIVLCVIAAIPVMVLGFAEEAVLNSMWEAAGVDLLLIMCAAGVKMIVLTCIRQGGFDKLLEEGDYTRINKRAGRYDGIYWAIVLAIYLGWSFVTMKWEFTWIVWPIGGVLFAAYREIVKAIVRSKNM